MKPYEFISFIGLVSFSQACAPASPVSDYSTFVETEKAVSQAKAQEADTSNCDKSCQNLRQEFRYVVYVGKKIYCYWDEKKAETNTDFDRLAKDLEASITTNTTPTEYYQALGQWASAFHDGHVNVLMKKDTSELEVYSAPVRLEVLAPATEREQVIVAAVDETPVTIEKQPGALVGDEVTAINGVEIGEALNVAEKTTSGSTKRMRRFFATRRLVDVLGTKNASEDLTLSLKRKTKDKDGKIVESTLKVSYGRTAQLAATPVENPYAFKGPGYTGVEVIKAISLPHSLGYLRIDGFGGSQSDFLIAQAMKRLSNTKGLIIDMRRNGGGDQSGNSILAALTSKKITRYQTSNRMDEYILANRPEIFSLVWKAGDAFSEWMNLDVEPVSKEKPTYAQPVVILTSPNCFSACDTFVSALKTHSLATVMGEGTGGGTGSPLVFGLPHSGHSFRYSVVKGKTAKGDVIEGVGTLPDITLEPSIDDRLKKIDRQLGEAAAFLVGKQQQSETPKIDLGFVPRVNEQSLTVSPTIADDLALKAISQIDER